jgi:hypothetical protein
MTPDTPDPARPADPADQLDLFDPARPFASPDTAPPRRRPRRALSPNPCVRVWGPDPGGHLCRTCRHLIRPPGGGHSLKCAVRGTQGGSATNHRATWIACARYEDAPAGRGPLGPPPSGGLS